MGPRNKRAIKDNFLAIKILILYYVLPNMTIFVRSRIVFVINDDILYSDILSLPIVYSLQTKLM